MKCWARSRDLGQRWETHLHEQRREEGIALAGEVHSVDEHRPPLVLATRLGLYPIVTPQHSSTTLYQVSYHIE